MTDTVDKAFESSASFFEHMARTGFDILLRKLDPKPQSKIEEALLAAMCAFNELAHVFDFTQYVEGSHMRAWMDSRPFTASLVCQGPVLEYRADFLITVTAGGEEKGRIVVECDGHNFHERTKEQAAHDRSRDRRMAAAGYRVLRFTGSEIYRDAFGCSTEVYSAILDVAGLRKP